MVKNLLMNNFIVIVVGEDWKVWVLMNYLYELSLKDDEFVV